MSTPRKPILIGQVETIDPLLPEVRAMMQHQGIYLARDSARPGFTVPLVVNADGLFSVIIDKRLDPERFLDTVQIAGPFYAPGEEITRSDPTCTCPSGDGSLRSPCPAHASECATQTTATQETGIPDRMAIRMLVAAGYVAESKANEALNIAHGFQCGELEAAPAPAAPGIDIAGIAGRLLDKANEVRSNGMRFGLNSLHETADVLIECRRDVLSLADASSKERAFLSTVAGLEFDSPMDAVAQARPKDGSDAVWHNPGDLPDVAPGAMGWFWVAVRRANGMSYNFPASYLNSMLLSDENRAADEPVVGNRYSHGAADEMDGSFPATGWHNAQEHSEYDNVYMPLLSDGDELIAWRAVEDFTQQPTSHGAGVSDG